MTLKEALKAFILTQVPDGGPVFLGEISDDHAGDAFLIRDAGSWNTDPSGYWRYPALEVTVRATDQDDADARSVILYEALNTGRALQLHGSYTVARSSVPAPPESEGRDQPKRWLRRLECNFLTHAAAAI